MFKNVTDFLLGQWLWSITWDWYHVPVAIIIMFLLFKLVLRLNIIPAVLMSLGANLYSFVFFTIFSYTILYNFLNLPFAPEISEFAATEPLRACIYLGLIYTVIQASFFGLVRLWFKIPYALIMSMALLSHLITAFIIHGLLPNPLM